MYKVQGMDAYEADKLFFEWTTEPPTEAGWYWIRAKVIGHEVVGVAQYPYTSNVNIDKITHWLGPLPIPAPPVLDG